MATHLLRNRVKKQNDFAFRDEYPVIMIPFAVLEAKRSRSEGFPSSFSSAEASFL